MAGSNGVPQANGKANDLPDSRSPALQLTHPTEAEKLRQLTLNGESWRGALTLEAYLRREVHLASQEATHNGGISFWALVDKPDIETRRVLCACETYRKRAVVAYNGTVTVSMVHGIGSVFCPPDLRGRGYAGRLMEMLGERLGNWQAEEGCPFSVLFSDIGKVSLRA